MRRTTSRTGWGVLTLCLVQLVDVLGVTVVVTALPSMLRDLGAPASAGSLVATGYAMCFGGLLMFGARLGDLVGHRRTILLGLAAFAAGALLAALAWSVVALAVARCLQGAGAALSVPAALRLLTTITEPGVQRRRAVAWWSAAGALAGAAGFVVGGVATQVAGWRWAFWVLLPMAALLVVAVLGWVPQDCVVGRGRRLEPLSALLLTAAVTLLVVATTELPQPGRAAVGVGLLAAAVIVGLAFVAVTGERRARCCPDGCSSARRCERGRSAAPSTPRPRARRSRWRPSTCRARSAATRCPPRSCCCR